MAASTFSSEHMAIALVGSPGKNGCRDKPSAGQSQFRFPLFVRSDIFHFRAMLVESMTGCPSIMRLIESKAIV